MNDVRRLDQNQAPNREVLKAFQKARGGRQYLSHDLASEVAFMEATGTSNPLKRMTVRELQTLALLAEGKPYGVIDEHLHVGYKTVANTCTQLKAKLGVRTLPELMRIAIQHLPSAVPARGTRYGPERIAWAALQILRKMARQRAAKLGMSQTRTVAPHNRSRSCGVL
jgi:DNA-binding CsgD family transcriptional regulator